MLELYFVRHGQTDYNLRGIVQGSGINSDLNELGRKQAKAFYEAYKHIHFDRVFASDLKRTHQTLAPWLKAGYSLETDSALNEFSWGIHEGAEPTSSQRAEFEAMLKKWTAGDLSLSVPEGESPLVAWDRASDFFEKIKQEGSGRFLFCSHGRQLRIILANLLGEHMSSMEKYKHSNTGISILHLEKDKNASLQLLNNVDHLLQMEKI